MKNNLKNRPRLKIKLNEDGSLRSVSGNIFNTERWFEGFEKELRQKLKPLKEDDDKTIYLFQGKLIEEILGE